MLPCTLCNIIINYLTPLPKLIFEDELIEGSFFLKAEDKYYFYPDYFVRSWDHSQIGYPFTISHRRGTWNYSGR